MEWAKISFSRQRQEREITPQVDFNPENQKSADNGQEEQQFLFTSLSEFLQYLQNQAKKRIDPFKISHQKMLSIFARVFEMNEKQVERSFYWIDRRCFFHVLVALTIYSVLAKNDQFEQKKFMLNLDSIFDMIEGKLMYMDMANCDPQFLMKSLIFNNKPLVNVLLQHYETVDGLYNCPQVYDSDKRGWSFKKSLRQFAQATNYDYYDLIWLASQAQQTVLDERVLYDLQSSLENTCIRLKEFRLFLVLLSFYDRAQKEGVFQQEKVPSEEDADEKEKVVEEPETIILLLSKIDLKEMSYQDIAFDVQSLIGTLWNTLCKHTVERSSDLTSEQIMGQQGALDLSSQPQYDFFQHAENLKNQKVINFGEETSLKDEMVSYLAQRLYPDYIEKEQVIKKVSEQVFGEAVQLQDESKQSQDLSELDDGYTT